MEGFWMHDRKALLKFTVTALDKKLLYPRQGTLNFLF